MIQVAVDQHARGKVAGKWDIYVYDGSLLGDLLLFSNQGYENRADAERIVERLFNDDAPDSAGAESVDLVIRHADGSGSHRMLR